MIVPMKKVSLIVMGDKREDTLKTLRKAGLVHIAIEEGYGEKLETLKSEIALLESAIYTLSEKKLKDVAPIPAQKSEAEKIAREIQRLSEERGKVLSEKIALESELDRYKLWGDINPEDFEELNRAGIEICLYETSKTEYAALGEKVKTLCLEKTKSSVKFLLLKTGEEDEQEVLESLSRGELKLPENSTEFTRKKLNEAIERVKKIDEKIISYVPYKESLDAAISEIQKEIEFEVYATGMATENLENNENRRVSVAYFTGYIEAENADNLKKIAKENSWGIAVEEPSEEDNVPTKLKNNKFVSLVYPLTDFLGTVPGYFEYDISSWFLWFILIFFGIIFGDGGYGLLVSAVAALLIGKKLVSKEKIPPTFLLIGLFGLSTVLWGTLTCTWFGLSPEQLPHWLKSLSIPVISNVYADKIWQLPWTQQGVGLTTAENLRILCFALALVQLSIAHIKCARRNRKSLKILGDIGSIFQLIGIFYVVLSLVVNAQVFSFGLTVYGVSIGTIAIALIGVGFVMSFVFSNYEGSIVKSVLASLTNIVSVLLGVVNVFSDIVSYIRLWAVGLAGAAISTTVNELAGPLFGNFLFMILAIFILIFGHGLNMILNVLSVIVHGIRLNTLEFSSHLDMSWSGHKFKPFKE